MRSNTYTPKDRPDGKFVPRWFSLLAVPALIFLLACPGQKAPETKPPATNLTEGYILVDSPEVFGRERLIRDREQQKKWLKEQLTIPDEAFDAIQAQVQNRSLSSSKLSFGIDATAATGLGIRQADAQSSDLAREQEIADLNHQIQIAKLQNDLEQVRAGKTLTSMPVATETGSGTASGEGAAGSGSAAGGAEATGGSTAAPAAAPSAGASPALANFAAAALAVKDSPINRFRDRLAYRELVRQELLENDLDDAHDLLGNTLYRWTFDTTVFPGKDASKWAIVEVELVSPSGCKQVSGGPELLQLMKGLEAAVERNVAFDISKAAKALLDKNNSAVDLETAGILKSDKLSKLRFDLGRRTSFAEQLQGQVEIKLFEKSSARTKEESTNFDRSLGFLNKWSADEQVELAKVRDNVLKNVAEEVTTSYKNEINLRGIADPFRFDVDDRGYVKVSVNPKECEDRNTLKCQLETFCKLVDRLPSPRVEPYAVTPKESVERIADLAIASTNQELVLTAGLSAGSIGFDSALQKIQQLETQRQAVRRQPLVVGFASKTTSSQSGLESQCRDKESAPLEPTDAKQQQEKRRPKKCRMASKQMPLAEPKVAHPDKSHTGEAYRVGWILGPSFAPRYGKPGFDFFQKANQIPLAAVVSVPAWWLSAEVKVRTCWLAAGSHASALCDSKQKATMKIELPGSANELARALFPRARRPQPGLYDGTPPLEIGRAERVVIYGDNLWRNPTVWLGSQQAVDVEILPDMKGIAATFDKVRQPPGWTPKQTFDLAAVWVWTSEGNAVAGDVRIYKPVTPPKEQKTPALFDVKSEVSFIRVDKDNRGAIGLNFKFDQKEEKGTKVNTIPKVFLVVENAILDPSQTPEAPSCLNKSAVPWEIKDSCRVEVHLQGLSPGQIVTVKTYRMDDKDEVPGDPISLEVR